MRGFSSLSRRRRRSLLCGGVALAAIAGFAVYNSAAGGGDQPLNVDFVLGGGDDIFGKGDKLAVQGSYEGLAAAPDNTVYLFTQEDDGMAMWRRKPSGAVKRIPISGMDNVTAQQAAVARDGSVYLAAQDLWKVSPAGKATKVINGRCKNPDPRATAAGTFCAGQITGVALAEDGSLYIGDQVNWDDVASYVHKVDGDSIELVAGRPPKEGETYKPSNPAVKNGINPSPGTRAKDVLVTDSFNSGWLASGKDGLYWRTGQGIVRINGDGTLSPFVSAAAPKKITEANGPYESVGKAVDARIPRHAFGGTRGDLTLVPGRDELYFSDAGTSLKPGLDGAYGWRGASSAPQKKLIEESSGGKLVHRVADGELSPVIAGVQAIAGSPDALYAAVEAEPAHEDRSPEEWTTAVVRVELPE